jgi:hypothetical protein
MYTSPAVVEVSPEMTASRLVLPDPDGPVTARLSPAATVTSMPEKISWPSRTYRRPRAWSMSPAFPVDPVQLHAIGCGNRPGQ